jgi:hypothetical protein
MNGRFPCDCESCDCPDKKYVEITTTAATPAVAVRTRAGSWSRKEKNELFPKWK